MQYGNFITYLSRQMMLHKKKCPTHDSKFAAVLLPQRFGDVIDENLKHLFPQERDEHEDEVLNGAH